MGLPWTILRATQFHQLARLATGLPSGRVSDMGGPHIRSAADLLRAYLHAAGQRRLVLPIRLPSAAFAGCRRGGHLAPDPDGGAANLGGVPGRTGQPTRAVTSPPYDRRRQDVMVRTAVWLRVGLLLYLAVTALVGMWAALWPRSFYDDFPWPGHPWVALLGAYNEHLVRDFGAMNLAMAVGSGSRPSSWTGA